MKKAVCIVFIFLIAMTFSSCIGESLLDCPDFVGKDYSIVSKAEQYDMFKLEAEYVSSENDDGGKILSQSVAVGTKIKKGTKIKVKVSLGLPKSGVPNVVGQTAELAIKTIEAAGFKAVEVYVPNSEYEQGICFRTSPGGSGSATVGGEVSIYISLGNEKKLIKYINVVGKTQEIAQKKLTEIGLNIGKITYEKSDKEKGTVIAQFPNYKKSIEIAEGSVINLTIAE